MTAINAKEQAGKGPSGVLKGALKERADDDNTTILAADKSKRKRFMLARLIGSSMNAFVCSFTAASTAELPAPSLFHQDTSQCTAGALPGPAPW